MAGAAQSMSASEALMWAAERDPVLRSTFLNITLVDRPPDMARLRRRMEDAIDQFPRMRQRVRNGAPWEYPQWVDDASFQLDYHIRQVALPPPGTLRQLLDLAGLWLEDAFDPVRPLWQMTVVEGLPGGGAALLAKMHHTITDGVGGLRLSSSFLDLDRSGDTPVRLPAATQGTPAPSAWDRALRTLSGAAGALDPRKVPARTVGGVKTAVSLARQVSVGQQSGSPLWRGRSSMGRHLDTVDLDLDEVRAAGKALGGTINDVFVAGVAGGAIDYHRSKGVELEHLRVSVPVSTRTDRSFGGNAFAPARVVLPAAGDARSLFDSIHERLDRARHDRSLGAVNNLAAALLVLPRPVLTPLARSQVATVDLAASNLRGSPVDLYVAGARVTANYPMGPTAGIAFNATVLSYLSRLDMGIVSDPAAIDDPDLLRRCISGAFAALTSGAG